MLEQIHHSPNILFSAIVIGVVATATIDGWALLLKAVFGIPSLDFALVGRWIGHLFNGQLVHQGIGKSATVRGEGFVGWTAHYLIGVIFALVFLLLVGVNWLVSPGLIPALLFGAVTVVFPYFLMQPCFGMGIAASKTPAPNKARVKSLVTHLVFGFGLYIAAIPLAYLS